MNEPTTPETAPVEPTRPTVEENLASPAVTYALVVITVVIFILQQIMPIQFPVSYGFQVLPGVSISNFVVNDELMAGDIPSLLGNKVNELIIQGQYWRLLTPMFLHGNFLHIGFNMYALIIIGSELERRFGHGRFLLLYFLGSLGGNVLSFILSAHPSVGASTSIFGLLGAEVVFFYQNRELFGAGAKRAIQNVVTVAGVNLLIGSLAPNIDNWGHLGGLLAGLIFTWFGGPKLKLQGSFPFFEVVDERKPIDLLLGAGLVVLLFGTIAFMKIFWG